MYDNFRQTAGDRTGVSYTKLPLLEFHVGRSSVNWSIIAIECAVDTMLLLLNSHWELLKSAGVESTLP